jgi:Na+-transporting NADH:ubiquinone oxidoreductase subunit NqrE
LTELIGIIVTAVLVNNLALIKFLGASSFFANTNRLQSTIEPRIMSFLVLFAASTTSLVLFRWLLVPANMTLVINEAGGELLNFALLQPGALLIMGLLLAAKKHIDHKFLILNIKTPTKPAKRARITGKP